MIWPCVLALSIAFAFGIHVGEKKTTPTGTWQLTWQDEFDGTMVNSSNWNVAGWDIHGRLLRNTGYYCYHCY